MLLESAYFLPSSIRRTARNLSLPSDASYRFERGVDPGMILRASARATQLLRKIAGGVAAAETLVAGVLPAPPAGGSLRYARCQEVIGAAVEPQETDIGEDLIRYPREEAPEIAWSALSTPIESGRAEVLCRGDGELMVWAYGHLVATCWKALDQLGDDAGGRPLRRHVTLVNARFAKPFDAALLAELAASHQRCLTAEDHALPGGFGAIVAETAADLGLVLPIVRAGVRDELVAHAPRPRQLADHGLDIAGVAERIRRLLGAASTNTIPFAAG